MVREKTLIVIAHKLSSIKHADNIIVVDDGKIVEQGNHGVLLENNGIYSTLWNKRMVAKPWKIER